MSELEGQTNNIEDTQTVDKVKDSITFLINLVSVCVERGGYNIDDVVKIKSSIEKFTDGNSNEESQKNSVISLINYIHMAQNKGKLTLEEAYHAYNSIDIFRT
jgi:hypothetical protein